MFTPLTELNRIIRENRIDEYRSPNQALGMHPKQFSRGKAEWIWQEQPANVLNPFGTIQGGFLALFVDEICGTALGSVLEPGEWGVTVESKISHLRAARPGVLLGTGVVIHRTRTIAFLEARVENHRGEPIAVSSSTWAIGRAEGT